MFTAILLAVATLLTVTEGRCPALVRLINAWNPDSPAQVDVYFEDEKVLSSNFCGPSTLLTTK